MAATFPAIVYLLCFATSTACAGLLARGYRRVGARVLLWSALCFAFLALSNLALVVDLVLIPDADLRFPRALLNLAAVAILLFGFIWDLEER